MNEIIQFKITLKNTKPPIWRRVLVKKNRNFKEFHHIIQIAMGWGDYHLYEFKVDGYRIGEPDEDFDDFYGNDKLVKAAEVTLGKILSPTSTSFAYDYDFGDGWEHKITVEKFLDSDAKLQYPHCLKGKWNCPPEDCGGIWGFYDILKIQKNKKHPQHKELMEWVGPYDASYFSIDETNKTLHSLDEYIKDWNDSDF